ncbi:MAG: hypothetical protein JST19_14560 [Bacteroidetes bacterium]|nr:hypothetical protein [Bacteroidota bacterium]
MKIKLLIPLLSAVLFVVFLAIDLKANHDSALDKWMSFGMGITVPVFIASLVSADRLRRKLNPKS